MADVPRHLPAAARAGADVRRRRRARARTCATSASRTCTSRRRSRRARARRTATTWSTRRGSRTRSAARTGFRALAAAARAAGLGIVLDIVPNHMATDDANPYWADPERRATVLRPRSRDRPPPALLRHRPPRRRAPGGPRGVRRDAPAGARARARGARRRAARRPSRRARRSRAATSSGCATAARSTSGWRRSSTPASSCATGRSRARSATSSSTTSRALFVDPAGEAPLTALWEELCRRRAAVRRVGGRGQARAGAHDVRARRRLAAAAVAGGRRARGGARRAARLPHLHPRRCRRPEDLRVLREAGLDRAGSRRRRRRSSRASSRRRRRSWPRASRTPRSTATCGCSRSTTSAATRAASSIGVDAFHAGNARARRALPAPPARHARRTTRSARATCARGSARSPGWRRSGRRRCARWRELCAPLRAGGAPDAIEEYTIFQTLVGAWPIEPERLCAYMEKALREAKRNTSWVEPDAELGGARARATAARSTTTRRSARRSSRSPSASRRPASCTRCARPRSS